MQLIVKSLVGRELTVDVDSTDRVYAIKERIEEKEGIPPDQQKLVYIGKQIDDNKTIAECGLGDGAKLHLTLSLRGGL